MSEKDAVVPLAVLRQFGDDILQHVGVAPDDAALVADALVKADARGMHSHGITRLPVYTRRILMGGARARTTGRVLSETPATLLLDGEDGIGQVVAARAMRESIRKARTAGTAAVGVRRSNHFGEGAYYVVAAIEAGMIGLITTGGSPNMPYWGAQKPVLGTLPLAVGVPADREPPILLDMAFGTVSKGKILQAAARGERIPADWGVDADGSPTDDPRAILNGGWTLPIGGYKGSGLILIMEILASVLTGANFATEVRDLYGDHAASQGVGHFVLSIDVSAFMPLSEFSERVDRLIRIVKDSGSANAGVLMPGEREHRLALRREEEGVPLPASTLSALVDLAKEVGFNLSTEGGHHLVAN